MLDICLDTLLDGVKLLPFLFFTYLLMELLEHRAGDRLVDKIARVDKAGPLLGAAFGVVPQCGFSAAASSMYAGRIITLGTLIAIYLSTSDEMLPILISSSMPPLLIVKILAIKLVIAMISGFAIEIVLHCVLHRKNEAMDIHTVCEEEHCHCEDGVLVSAVKHTIRIFVYILIISFVLNFALEIIGPENLKGIFSGVPVLGQMTAALVGLIPNCASSVVITSLYVDGMIDAGMMMAGLLANAGVGFLVLFRLNRNIRQNMSIVGIVYVISVLWGILISFVGL
ncbi:MAG: putative manganese transporter [bacterium]|nr:putative manganese transporter [bacterium]